MPCSLTEFTELLEGRLISIKQDCVTSRETVFYTYLGSYQLPIVYSRRVTFPSSVPEIRFRFMRGAGT
jgi:hypothetical protein